MAYPLLRPIAYRVRAAQTPVLHRLVVRPSSHPMELPQGAALIVAPHPDDETFGCGGLIAMKRALGVDVAIVIMTDGGQSKVADTSDPTPLVQARKNELLAATGLLGVSSEKIHFLDGPDGGLSDLSEAARNAMSRQIRDLIEATGAVEVYVPHRHDRHADHEATYRIVRDALNPSAGPALANEILLIEYLVWLVWKRPLLSLSLAELRGAGRLDVRHVQALKDQAIAVYRSQLATMPPGFLPQFGRGEEYYWVNTIKGETRPGTPARSYMLADV